MAAVEGTRSNDHGGAVPPRERVAFARLVAVPSARAIAATGLLIHAFAADGIPFHASVGTTADVGSPDDATIIAVGEAPAGEDESVVFPTAVIDAVDPAAVSPHAEGLAAAATWDPSTDGEGALGVPTADWTEGVSSSTLVRGPFSGDADEEWIEAHRDLEEREWRSALALSCLDDHPTAATSAAVTGFLDATPLPDGPFATDAGTIDVLDVLSARHPGLALAVCCGGRDHRDVALTTWRREASAVHAAIDGAGEAARNHRVIRIEDAPLGPTARVIGLVREAGEPFVVTDGTAVAVGNAPDRWQPDQLTNVVRHVDARLTGNLVGDLEDLVATLQEGDT